MLKPKRPVKKRKKTNEDRRKLITNYISLIPNFAATFSIEDAELSFAIIFDENRNLICLISIKDNEIEKISGRIIGYKDVLSSELIQNGVSIEKTIRSSQVAGALVGSVLLGGLGAVVGGLSAKREKVKSIDYIAIKLTLNHIKSPLYDIVFFDKSRNSKLLYKECLELAWKSQATFKVLIESSDKNLS